MKYIVNYKEKCFYEDEPSRFIFKIMNEDEFRDFADIYILSVKNLEYAKDGRGVAKNKPLVRDYGRSYKFEEIESYIVPEISEIKIDDFISEKLEEKINEYNEIKKLEDEKRDNENRVKKEEQELEEYNRLKRKFEKK